MKKGILIGLVLILSFLGGIAISHEGADNELSQSWWPTPEIAMAASNTTDGADGMIVFWRTTDDLYLFWCELEAEIVDNGDGTWDVYSDQGNKTGISQAVVDYDFFKYKKIKVQRDDQGHNLPIYMYDLNLKPMSGMELPKSQHIGILKAVNPALAKPATVTRTYYGVDYDVQCFVSQSVVDMWQSNDLEVGDYVVVSFITEAPGTTEINIAIVVDKVYPSW